MRGKERKVQNASGQSRPLQLPIGAGSSSKFPPAFPDEKRWIIDLFWPGCLLPRFPRVPSVALLAPLDRFSTA